MGWPVLHLPTGTERLNFALATTLSNVCHLLNVELVQEHNTGVMPYWGQTGHYSIGSFAARFTGGGKLGTLIDANLDRISFARGDLDAKRIKAALKDARDNGDFVPLADVPDLVWKNFPNSVTGGRDNRPAGHGSTGPEHPTHYADIDEPRPSDGKTLRQLSLVDPTTNLTVKYWQAFYDRVRSSIEFADQAWPASIPSLAVLRRDGGGSTTRKRRGLCAPQACSRIT